MMFLLPISFHAKGLRMFLWTKEACKPLGPQEAAHLHKSRWNRLLGNNVERWAQIPVPPDIAVWVLDADDKCLDDFQLPLTWKPKLKTIDFSVGLLWLATTGCQTPARPQIWQCSNVLTWPPPDFICNDDNKDDDDSDHGERGGNADGDTDGDGLFSLEVKITVFFFIIQLIWKFQGLQII